MKKRIAIVTGGDSGEYEISRKSAQVISEHIDRSRFEPWILLIRGSHWVALLDQGGELEVNKNDFSLSLQGETLHFDGVFMMIHGSPGEDGKLPAYFEMLGIPYTGCNWATSSLASNKGFCNGVVKSLGLNTARSMVVYKDRPASPEKILQSISLPCFVKPNCGGSSVGTSKVKEVDALAPALELAFREDPQVMVEEFLEGREITCGVFRCKGEVIALPLTEVVSKNEFFDYEAKYTDGMADEITPAPVSETVREEVQRLSAQLYEQLNCAGLVRFDFILGKYQLYFLELNTIPGMSENSIVPQQARAYGLTLSELISRLLDELPGA